MLNPFKQLYKPQPTEPERLPASNYEVRERHVSQYDPSYMHTMVIGYRCPRCKKSVLKLLRHGEHTRCKVCGLQVLLLGASLEVQGPDIRCID